MSISVESVAGPVQSIIARHVSVEGPLLPILHAVQEEFGHIPQEALPIIAKGLNLSRAEVHGVVTFYHDFRADPAGRNVIKLCRAEACQSMGSERIAAKLEKALGVSFGETAADGSVTLEAVYCLGLCACAPAAMIDGRLIGRVDEKKADEMIARTRS